MKLTTNQIIDLFKALCELRGAPQAGNGRPGAEPILVPYPMSDKARWNAAKDRTILKRLVIAHDEMNQDAMAELTAFKKTQRETVKPDDDPKVRSAKMEAAQRAIQVRVDEMNVGAVNVGRIEQEVDGLLLIPASGLCPRGSPIPPTLISELMPLIDGEPEFDEPQTEAKKK